jgi:hypothetical protein
MSDSNTIRHTKTTIATFEAPDLLLLVIRTGEVLTVDESNDIALWMKQHTTAKYKVLTAPQINADIEPEVRNYLVQPQRAERVCADALVINNLPHRLLADFYLKFNRPDIPTRFFSSEEEAREWLKTQ